jgi:hypothetical protein
MTHERRSSVQFMPLHADGSVMIPASEQDARTEQITDSVLIDVDYSSHIEQLKCVVREKRPFK